MDPNDVDDHLHPLVDPDEAHGAQNFYDFDADDVSYRLQLLVKNNYYLPPAHKKPFVPDVPVTPETGKKSLSKGSAPAFLDLFKMGKSRSKTTSPTAAKFPKGAQAPGPILRTTSDSSTVSVYKQQPSTLRSLPASPLIVSVPKPTGRVVVVRERMENVASAAKQAEKELKFRESEWKRHTSELAGNKHVSADVVDPTDAVDIPPPMSGGYPFAPQASALNALGIEASIGAAVLAERLPPANEWSWTMDAEEESWRKELLQQAVSHSLNSSIIVTPSSSPAVGSSMLHSSSSISSRSSVSTSSTLRRKRQLGQRIIPHIPDDEVDRLAVQSPQLHSQTREDVSRLSTSTDPINSAGQYILPGRVETPIPPPQPLAPPPRKNYNPSISHISLSESEGHRNESLISPRLPWTIRKVVSDPALSNTSDNHFLGLSNRPDILTPPPSHTSRMMSIHQLGGYLSPGNQEDAASSQYYSDDQHDGTVFHSALEEQHSDPERPCTPLSISMKSDSRASSEYSQPIPGLRDTMISPENDSIVYRQYHRAGIDSITRASSTFGDYVSPPPRTSSTFSHHALTPAPRSRAIHGYSKIQSTPLGRTSASQDSMSSRGNHSIGTDALHGIGDIPEHDSTIPENMQSANAIQSSLLPPENIHNTREPPSPISFFDEIEMQNGSSGHSDILNRNIFRRHPDLPQEDDASDRDNPAIFVDPTSEISDSSVGRQSASALMRLGNRSNPYILATKTSHADSIPVSFDVLDRRRAIMNTAGPSRSENRSPGGIVGDISTVTHTHAISKHQHFSSSFDELSELQGGPLQSVVRPQTASSEKAPKQGSSNVESVNDSQRLDGLLLEHIEKEKDTLRRITSTLTKS